MRPGSGLVEVGALSWQVGDQFARGAGQGDTEAISWLARAAGEARARSLDVVVTDGRAARADVVC